MNSFKLKHYSLNLLFTIIFLVLIGVSFSSVLAVQPLGSYNISKPVVLVNYSENPVTIIDYSLRNSLGFDYSDYFSQLPNESNQLNKVFNFTPQIILFNDNYFFDINARDEDFNYVSASATFNIDKPQMLIKLISPKFGIAQTRMFNVTILTGEKAICRYGRFPGAILNVKTYDELYDDMPLDFNQTNATLNNITDITISDENKFEEWVVVCKKSSLPSGVSTNADENFAGLSTWLGYDSDASTITASAVPNPVFDWDNRKTNITVTTNDKTVCTINDSKINKYFGFEDPDEFMSYQKKHSIIIDYSDSIYDERRLGPLTFPYNIKCTNLAQWDSSSAYTVDYLINNSLKIERNCPEYVNSNSMNLSVKTSITATCTIYYKNTPYALPTGTIHTRLVSDLVEGRNKFNASCSTSSGLVDFAAFDVFVDKSAPTLTIDAHENSCGLNKLNFVMNAIDANGSGIREYNYTIQNSTGTILREGTSFSSSISLSMILKENQTYTISGYAIDRAGNPSNLATATIKASQANLIECDFIAPTLLMKIMSKETTREKIYVNVTCSDIGSGCKSTFELAYLQNKSQSCDNEDAYYEEQSYSTDVPLEYTSTGKLCAIAYDNNNNNATAQLTLSFSYQDNGTASSDTNYIGGDTFNCNNNIQDGDETDVDCGGSCDACLIGKTCFSDYDCYSRNCMNTICTESSCDNGKEDGTEEGVDCGGNCELACETDDDEQPEIGITKLNPVGLFILLVGVLILLASGGYIIYMMYFSKSAKEMKSAQGSKQGFFNNLANIGKKPQHPQEIGKQDIHQLSADEQKKLQLQKEKLIKTQQEKSKDRKSLLSGFDEDSGSSDDELKKIAEKPSKNKISAEKEENIPEQKKHSVSEKHLDDGYAELSELWQSKDRKTELADAKQKKYKGKSLNSKRSSEVFDKLDELGKGVSNSEISSKLSLMSGQSEGKINSILSSDSLSQTETLTLFKGLSKKEITSDVFKEILSKLLLSGKIPKETVSNVLFEFMDEGTLSKADVAKILHDLKLI